MIIAIQKDTQTHLCIHLMNKDTYKDLFIQFKMSDGITYCTVLTLATVPVLVDCVLTPEYSHLNGQYIYMLL